MNKNAEPGSDQMDVSEITRFLTAIGDPVRLQLLFLLGNKGERKVGDIAAEFPLSRPAISHHLKVLKEAGVLDSRKAGQEMFYWIQRDHVVSSLRALANAAECLKCGP